MKRYLPPVRRLLPVALALAVLAVSGAAVRAQQDGVRAEARLTRTEATVGDRVGFEIVVRGPAGTAVTVPDLPLRVGDLDLIERLPDETSPDGTEHRYRYVLAPFQTGDLFVAPIQVRYRTVAGRDGTAQTDALPLRVTSVIPANDPATTVRDLRPQADVAGKPFQFPWPVVAGAAGALAALLILLRILRGLLRGARRRASMPPVYLTPEDAALAALDELAAAGTPTRRTLKDYYGGLSLVVRRYLSERYGFPAQALTTTEMEPRMAGRELDRWQARLVSGLLVECDAVRYAQYVPAQQRAQDDLALAYEIVEVGRPRTLLPGEEAASADPDEPDRTEDSGEPDAGVDGEEREP